MKPFFEDPINYYSLLHFVEYGFLALFPAIKTFHIVYISLLWEILEVLLPYEWAKESALNKCFDIIFNLSGFYFSRYFNTKYKP